MVDATDMLLVLSVCTVQVYATGAFTDRGIPEVVAGKISFEHNTD